jgi:hypothetical protein
MSIPYQFVIVKARILSNSINHDGVCCPSCFSILFRSPVQDMDRVYVYVCNLSIILHSISDLPGMTQVSQLDAFIHRLQTFKSMTRELHE